MNRAKVSSSNLVSVGYDSAEKMLEIECHGGGVYQYSDVPEAVHLSLMASQSFSIGKYFHKKIRGQYEHRMINE